MEHKKTIIVNTDNVLLLIMPSKSAGCNSYATSKAERI